LRQVAIEPGAGVVHGLVEPQAVKRIAQVVVGVDVFLAVGARVAVEQVFDAVHQAPGPGPKDDAVHLGAVFHQHAQQFHQIGGAPVTGYVGFCKADVTRFERG